MGLELNVIKASEKDLKANFVEMSAFLINDAAGHNAGLNHGGESSELYGKNYDIPFKSIMSDGDIVFRGVRGWANDPQFTKLSDFATLNEKKPKSPLDIKIENRVIRTFFYRRFGDHIATPSKSLKNKVE